MKSLIENYMNGNLSECRRQAKRHSRASIENALVEMLGYTNEKAYLTALWMKTGEGFQAACDA